MPNKNLKILQNSGTEASEKNQPKTEGIMPKPGKNLLNIIVPFVFRYYDSVTSVAESFLGFEFVSDFDMRISDLSIFPTILVSAVPG
jgi:H+/gluconate symporter-like permease